MGTFGTFGISASGLTAERLRMDIIAGNLANANTTRSADGEPYQRRFAVFAPIEEPGQRSVGRGVRVVGIYKDRRPPKLVYDPNHPDADEHGFVSYPNVEPVREMVDLITATRAYEANVTAFNAAKNMANKALEIGR